MSKQDLIEYTTENFGRAESLRIHLSANFYPPLPSFVKQIFIDAFNQYWSGLTDINGLEKELKAHEKTDMAHAHPPLSHEQKSQKDAPLPNMRSY